MRKIYLVIVAVPLVGVLSIRAALRNIRKQVTCSLVGRSNR